ncbi:MAG: hypothetical protein GX769_02090 [Erysipelothrix sp.]|nr:hypothetical protein [Erysipelothrix sp.]
MKKRNKYTNLANGMAFLALNNGSPAFTLLSTYGLMMIRDFTIKQNDRNMKIKTEAFIALNILRGALSLIMTYREIFELSIVLVFLNLVIFVMTLIVFKEALVYLSKRLEEFDLSNLVVKVRESYYTVIVVESLLIGISLVVLFTVFFPLQFLLNFTSLFLNPGFNVIISLGLTLIKYIASRSFSRAAVMLHNAAQI